MPLGIRGANPIWVEFDLEGNLFDDTFWLYVLENVLPYAPATVYHDPDLNLPWTNPIQYLANGTLPNDIYFETDKVYRLEFRQSDGINPPSQSDPLIYEVNNYVAGSGGSTPVDTVAFASSNQITNPQFAVINFSSPFSLISATNPDPIQIGPGWFLELVGTGSVTLTKVPLNNANANPSNAPFALRLQLTGWSNNGVFLVQRFGTNGMLWANKIVSSTITARIEGAPQGISANLLDSNGSTLAQVLNVPTVNEAWNEYTGYGELPATTNPDIPPAAYIEYKLALPSNVDIYVTSIQLVVQELPIEPSFEQDTVERQVDHMYHSSYPIVPVGTVIDYYGFGSPQHYVICFGQALNRITFNQLFNVVTTVEVVTLTTGVATFTVANGQAYPIGAPLEGIGIQASTVITNIVGNVVTMSNLATATGPQAVRFFCVGAGDGSTTFNAPDLRGFVLAGSGTPAFGTLFASFGPGTVGGATTHTLTALELPPHSHTYALWTNQGVGGFGMAGGTLANYVTTATGNGPGTSTPFSIVQPTRLAQKYIRYEV